MSARDRPAVSAEEQGYYKDVNLVNSGETSLDTPAGKLAAYGATFELRPGEKSDSTFTGKRLSHIVLTTYKGQLLELRMTFPVRTKGGDKALKSLLAELGEMLK